MVFKAFLVASATVLVVASVTTVVVYTSRAAPVTREERIDLSGLSLGLSWLPAIIGDRVEIAIEVRQKGDEYARCGEPSVVDPSGNLLALLEPTSSTPGAGASYQFAFHAASDGEYGVKLDNTECNIRRTAAEATVAWVIHR